MSSGGPRGEKAETICKKRKTEKEKYVQYEKVQYSETQRKRAVTEMKLAAHGEQVPFSEVRCMPSVLGACFFPFRLPNA